MHFKECREVESERGPFTRLQARLLEHLRRHFEASGKQFIFTGEKRTTGKFVGL